MMVNILTELAALRKSREHKTPARINRENKTPARMDGRRIFENSLGLPTFILCTGQKPPIFGRNLSSACTIHKKRENKSLNFTNP